MCGIFGAVIGEESKLRDARQFERTVELLFRLSESRGKEAAGLAIANGSELSVYKAAVPAREMMRARGYQRFLRDSARAEAANGMAFIGHSRLVTDGAREMNKNNQPVIARGIVGIHNGIIVNHSALWQRHAHLQRQYDVDSEIIFALVRDQLEHDATLADAASHTFGELQGAASVAALFDDRDQLLLATNNGSLYYRAAPESSAFVFASESYIMDRFAAARRDLLGSAETIHVPPGEGAIVDLSALTVSRFSLGQNGAAKVAPARMVKRSSPLSMVNHAVPDPPRALPPRSAAPIDVPRLEAAFPYVPMGARLRRCTRCVLPETMPFVDFDREGVCAYCRKYHQRLSVHGKEALEALVAPHRSRDGRPDCIVGVSGGRDSMYGLHYLKTVLGMNPVAYTYDWGMVTDLARRNVSRICGKLGIEHILVSADIPKKREYIRKNVEAWLAQPSLGTIPLFMAGDKAYFYYLQKAREQLGVGLSFLCENLLERTDFKTGFAGVAPFYDEEHVYTMPLASKFTLASFYAKQFATNPLYVNTSLIDTMKAFAFYYLIKRDYENLYRYVMWDEATIESTLLGEYDFELAEDTKSTWRIGDGTAPFYNFIYFSVAGMTENDTFRSNQIRNGAMDRARALELIDRDNRPRFPSIQWYLRTIGLDKSVDEVLETIARVPKLYGG